jgi:stalled ribosome rescue protein Dom34
MTDSVLKVILVSYRVLADVPNMWQPRQEHHVIIVLVHGAQLGAYHTIDLELNRKFTLYKNELDTIALQRVEEATDVAKTANVAALVCQEGVWAA